MTPAAAGVLPMTTTTTAITTATTAPAAATSAGGGEVVGGGIGHTHNGIGEASLLQVGACQAGNRFVDFQ